jgi:ATP-dependent RNA helicase MSS116
LIEDEAELSDWVSDLRTSSLRGKFTSDEDNADPEVVRRNVDRDTSRGPRRGREGQSDRFGGAKRGKEGEMDRFGSPNRRRTSGEPADSFGNKRLGDREGSRNGRVQGKSSESSFRGRSDRNVDSGSSFRGRSDKNVDSGSSFRGRNDRNVESGFRREPGSENNRGLGKQTRGLSLEEEDSSDDDENRVGLGNIDDLPSEDSSDEDDENDEPLIKKAASAKAVQTDKPTGEHVKTSDSYLSKTRFDQFPLSPLSLKAIKDAGFETMTVVQEATLPIILQGELFFMSLVYDAKRKNAMI